MTTEGIKNLSMNTLVGFTEKRGHAWWYRKQDDVSGESNHYPGAIPVEDVRRRLFDFTVEPWDVATSPRLSAEADAIDRSFRTWTPDPDRVAWVRSDTGKRLGYFSPGYQGHEYGPWLLDTMAALDLPIGSAGLLREGAIAWVQAELPENVATTAGVEFRPNLLNTTSFDGSTRTTYLRTATVVVCDNTYSMAMREGGARFAVSHSRNSLDRLAGAGEALGLLDRSATEFTAHIEALTEQAVTDRQWARFLDRWVPTVDARGAQLKPGALTRARNKRDTLNKLWIADPRVSPWRRTAFGVAQAINTFTHHETGVRGDRGERNTIATINGDRARVDAQAKELLEGVLGRYATPAFLNA